MAVIRNAEVVAGSAHMLRDRIAEPWTLDSLAEEAHLLRSRLMRAFDAMIGVSPMAYVRRMRVE